ncbi:MAG: peptidylprolyl isomerase [Ruminococcus sp.]|nr:peptidylprolyl isomerase [Ruminococcus sp.]
MKNNRSDYVPLRKRQFKLYFQFSMIAVCFVLVFAVFYACAGRKQKIDFSNAKIIQMDLPSDDTPVAVFETDMGTFKAVLFPDEAPKYYEYFKGLVEEGYYDDTYVNMVQDGVYFIGGAKQADAKTTSDTDVTELEAELSTDLWPLKGALCAYTYDKNSIFSKKKLSTSYLLFVNDYELTEEEQKEFKEMTESNEVPEDITNAFEEYGGVLNFSQQYTIFGQVYDGEEVYEALCGVDVVDSESLRPKNDIKFNKVYLSTYGENKNDAFFSQEQSSEMSSDETSAE